MPAKNDSLHAKRWMSNETLRETPLRTRKMSVLGRFLLLSMLGIGLALGTSCIPHTNINELTCEELTDEVVEAGIFLSLDVVKPRIKFEAIDDYESKCYSLIDDGTINKMYDYYDNGYVYTSTMVNTSWECVDNKFVLYMDEDVYKTKIKEALDNCLTLSYIKGILRVEVLLCDCEQFDY